ncbi:MAG: hypothetical protein ABH851_03335 [Methanobacteriota archaeon]
MTHKQIDPEKAAITHVELAGIVVDPLPENAVARIGGHTDSPLKTVGYDFVNKGDEQGIFRYDTHYPEGWRVKLDPTNPMHRAELNAVKVGIECSGMLGLHSGYSKDEGSNLKTAIEMIDQALGSK